MSHNISFATYNTNRNQYTKLTKLLRQCVILSVAASTVGRSCEIEESEPRSFDFISPPADGSIPLKMTDYCVID